jgi:Collagen triple helix repeat (20 copies)
VVTFNGSTYVAIAASSGPTNPTPDMNASLWSVLAQEGAPGAAGSADAVGPQGPIGATGTTGATGSQGLQDLAGSTGPQGPAGVAGTNGSGFDFRNTFDVSASYAINDVTTFNGSTYVAIAASSGPNNPTPDMNASLWSVMAQEGAAGAIGAQGSAGPTGATGSQGPAGPMGSAGINGSNGTNGTNGAAGASPFTLDAANAVFTGGSVGIGVDPPSTTAALDVTSTTKGLLAPRMTTMQRLAIASPANGLIVYDTDIKSLQVYDAVGGVWTQLAATATTGTVTTVTASAPLGVSNGTTTPAITLGTVPVAKGGTGSTSLTGFLVGNGTSAFSSLTAIPGTAISGNISGNAATATNATNVTGTVAVANGGTGGSAFTAGNILFGNGTSAINTNSNLFWDNTNNLLNVAGGLQVGNYTFATPLAGTLRWTGTALELYSGGGWSAIGSGNGSVTSVTGTSPHHYRHKRQWHKSHCRRHWNDHSGHYAQHSAHREWRHRRGNGNRSTHGLAATTCQRGYPHK